MLNKKSYKYYKDGYDKFGLTFQREYPNEEVIRFFAKYFYKFDRKMRSTKKVLELGCGSGANIWMLAEQGFDTYGIDYVDNALLYTKEILTKKSLSASLRLGDILNLPYDDNSFDVVFDCFSMNALNYFEHLKAYYQIIRVLKKGGYFFSYHPSTKSDAYKNHAPSKLLDQYTVDGIKRRDSPHYGYKGAFCFLPQDHVIELLEERDMKVVEVESVLRTYNMTKEHFYFNCITAKK